MNTKPLQVFELHCKQWRSVLIKQLHKLRWIKDKETTRRRLLTVNEQATNRATVKKKIYIIYKTFITNISLETVHTLRDQIMSSVLSATAMPCNRMKGSLASTSSASPFDSSLNTIYHLLIQSTRRYILWFMFKTKKRKKNIN